LVLPLSGESVLATIRGTRRNQHRAAMIAVRERQPVAFADPFM
jgi:hypothetical protein